MLLYIHIPFCDSKCHYCAFNSYVDKFHLKHQYMRSLSAQLQNELQRIKAQSIQTLFIGGGTPSTIAPELYAPIFSYLKPYLAPHAEITTEVNPNSATASWLEGMQKLGINRLSFGVQSFDDKKLKFLGRAHSAKEAKEAITRAKILGFSNISIDLIYDTIMDTKELLMRDLETFFSFELTHLSAYSLTIEAQTKFEHKRVSHYNEKLAKAFIHTINTNGFKQYEISNFGKVCQHNVGYWKYHEYLGIGSGAVGFQGNQRLYPHKDIERYIREPLYQQKEYLSTESITTEKVLLGLRSYLGVPKSLCNQNRAQMLLDEGKLIEKDNRYYNLDFFLADEIALFLLS